MRLLIAALSFLLGLYAISAGLIALLPPGAPEWLSGVGILIGFCLSLVLTNKLVNAQGTNFWSLARAPEPGEQLAAGGFASFHDLSSNSSFSG